MNELVSLRRSTGFVGALLVFIGLLTGGFAAFAMTGKVAFDGHSVLAAHLNAMLGGLWVVALATTLPMLRYSQAGLKRLVVVTVVPNVANWAITLLKAGWRVLGIERSGESSNDVVFGLLTVFVVAPSIVAAAAWAWGFLGPVPSGREG